MERAAIYARVSSDEQAEGHSLDNQVEQCQRYCEGKGYAVTKIYREDFTGTSATRPEMNDLLASHELFDVVVVYQVDRLSRSRSAMIVIEMELERLGKRTEFVVGNFDTSPEGNLFKNLMVDFAQFDRENQLRRLNTGKIGRVRSGQIMVSHPLFGYDYISKERQGRYVINEIEGEWVRKIFSWYVEEGVSILEVVRRMTKARVPTKADKLGMRSSEKFGTWYEIGIGRLLSNPAYYGEWVWGRGGRMPLVTVSIPAIISKETFDAAQERKGRNKLIARRNTKTHYLMRGRLRCQNCGQAYIASSVRRASGKIDRYYVCKGAGKSARYQWTKVCSGQLRADIVDVAVWEFVKERILHPEMVVEGMREKNELVKNSTAQFRATVQLLEEQLTKLDDRRIRLLDLYADNRMPKEDLERAVSENIRDSSVARERLIQLRGALGDDKKPDPDEARAFLADLAPGAEEATDNEREGVMADLDIRAEVSADKRTVILDSHYIKGVLVIA